MNARLNIVLVHGAWADGSSWSAVIQRLQGDGYRVTKPQFPLTALADDGGRGGAGRELDRLARSRHDDSASLKDER
jgi:hypothetical protein